MMLHIDITLEDERWPDLRDLAQKACETTLEDSVFKGQNLELSLVLADDSFVRKLNKNYRAQDKATNVLSFVQEEENSPFLAGEPHILGDIILAYETLMYEAGEQRKSFEDHTIHLIVHGLLHLIGYDHIEEEDAQEMEELEVQILNELGLKNPYETWESVRQ